MTKPNYEHCNFTDCKKPIYNSIKVKRLHISSGRKCWGTLKLCEKHWGIFMHDMKTKEKQWVSYYHKEKEPSAIVLDYKEIN